MAPLKRDYELRPESQFVTVGDYAQMTVVNYGPDTASYGSDKAANAGTIVSGDSATLTTGLWFKAAARAQIQAIGVEATATPGPGALTEDMLSVPLKALLVCGRVHDGANYPAREAGFAFNHWIGPSEPPDFEDGDVWTPTA